jgi:Lrp/AsnC family transcriptional regulator for asnA, asnC and gidA
MAKIVIVKPPSRRRRAPELRSGLDQLDIRILRHLQEDAHVANREIAKLVGTSEATVRRRIDRLLGQGLIKIVAVASPFALGYGVMAILGVKVDRRRLSSVSAALTEMDEVRFAGVTLGLYDIVLEAWLRSGEELIAFVERLHKLSGANQVESIQVLKLLKYSYDWGKQPSAALAR